MEIEEKKIYLKKYRVLQSKIERMREMIRLCPENAEKYAVKINESIELRDKIEREIDLVDGDVLSEVLSQKYICGKSLEQISYMINYSKRQVERLHLRALDAFESEKCLG